MASFIEGYEYDIFISYRQKDNKYDGWVTGFVDNLKKELEATFKEEISVYFDINPHDGLLETHDVDESLKEKLKCLVFIPILSRTYCDPKSFAWEHEFNAFINEASQDQFGLKVKLQGGNVTSRVLPVQIHDLDPEDKNLIEDALGGHLRGIEFIYKEPGVNKPLTTDDDERKNLNGTKYRIQINKVSNAIKGIITAMKQYGTQQEGDSRDNFKPVPVPVKKRKTTFVAGSFIAILLVVLGILFIPRLFEPSEQLEKSIAVLPFHNESDDQENNAFVNGLMEKIINNLQLIKDFRVISRTSVEQYRDQTKSIPEIAKELGVNYIIEGSGQRYGDAFSLSVQLIKADKREDHLWGRSFEQEIREVDDILAIQSEIAEAIAKELEANITADEKHLIDKIPTSNLTALDFYQQGREEYWKYQADPHNITALYKAESLYKKALEYDPTFGQSYLGLAQAYWSNNYVAEYLSENFLDSALVLANTALSYDDNLAEAYVIRGNYFQEKGYTEQAVNEYDKAIEINPSAWQAYMGRASLYLDIVGSIDDFHKALSLGRGRERPYLLENMCWIYMYTGFLEIGQEYNQERLKLTNDSSVYFSLLGRNRFWLSNLEDALKYYKKAYVLDSMNIEVLFMLGIINGYVGQYEESLLFCEKWLEQLDKTMVISFRYNGMQRVGYAYWKNNRFDEANYYFDLQMKFSNGQINENLPFAQQYASYYDRAGIYAFRGEKKDAYENLRVFNQQTEVPLAMVNLFKIDPLFDRIRNEPEFQQIVRDVEEKYQAMHERVRKWLEENNIL